MMITIVVVVVMHLLFNVLICIHKTSAYKAFLFQFPRIIIFVEYTCRKQTFTIFKYKLYSCALNFQS